MTRLIGLTVDELRAELGAPDAEHRRAADTWLVFRTPVATLRIRCSGPNPVSASCTATLATPAPTLSEAAGRLGLWPECEPEEVASGVRDPAVRRSVAGPAGESYSLMATVRAARFTQLTVFDEEPEWLPRG